MNMKKIISLMLAAILAVPMFAGEKQTPEERAKADYSSWLPEEGDWSLGFNLNPLAMFVGNMFNNTVGNTLNPMSGQSIGGNNALAPIGAPNMASIMGTYMVTDNLGIRANIGLGIYSWNRRAYVIDDAAKFANPYSTLEGLDKEHRSNYGASFSLGAEYRVGKTRPIQGVFGAGLTYGFWGVNKRDYSYYNAITDANQNPTNGGLYPGAINGKFATDYSFIDNPRMLKQYTAQGTNIIGLYLSAGVEWFVAPKIALGLNVNVLFDYQWNPERVEVWEGWNKFTQQRQEITIHDRAMQDGFTFSTANVGANLYVAFYFGK